MRGDTGREEGEPLGVPPLVTPARWLGVAAPDAHPLLPTSLADEGSVGKPAAASAEDAGVTRKEAPEGITAVALRRTLPPSGGLQLMPVAYAPLLLQIANKNCLEWSPQASNSDGTRGLQKFCSLDFTISCCRYVAWGSIHLSHSSANEKTPAQVRISMAGAQVPVTSHLNHRVRMDWSTVTVT